MPLDAADLDVGYDLMEASRAFFAQNGYVRLPRVLPERLLRQIEPEITGKVIELNTMTVPMAERTTYQKAFLQIGNLWQHSEVVRQLVHSRRLAKLAAELLGVSAVRLYQDQALYKEPGGGLTPYHADQYYWPLSTDRTCTIWIPLQQTPLAMGPLSFAAGSHRLEVGRDLPISDRSESELQQLLSGGRFPLDRQPYSLGDASFHLGWTFHQAQPNKTDIPRRVMTIIYMDADITVAEPVNDSQANDLAVCMPGAQPGMVPDTPLNPVLYRAGS